jgi:putative peptidoglycan lipid II flippase
VLFRSVMIAILPRMSRAHSTTDGDRTQFDDLTRLGLRLMYVVALPLTALAIVLAIPATQSLYQHGQFDHDQATLLGAVLMVYAISFIGSGIQRALLAPSYAVRDTRTPFRNTIYGVGANLLLLPLLVWLAYRIGGKDAVLLPILAVGAAYSLAQFVNVAHAHHGMAKQHGVDLDPTRAGLLRSTFAALAAGLSAGVVLLAGSQLDLQHDRLAKLLLVLLAGVVGVAAAAAVEMTDPKIRTVVLARRRRRPPPKSSDEMGCEA